MGRSRGSRRNSRRRKTIKAGRKLHSPSEGTESAVSKKYGSGGKTFGYNYRINGPVSEVKVTNVND